MKKVIILLLVLGILTVPATTFAQNGREIQKQDRIQDPADNPASASPQTNLNQVQVQNKGEETQLRTTAQYMQELMNMENLGEEVGNQIKTLAQNQLQAQSQIQSQLDKLGTKSKLMKSLFGPDYKAIENLKQQMEQNRLRIQQLTQLANQVQNQSEKTMLQEATQSLIQQNTQLQEQIEKDESAFSLFGWLVKLFN